MWFWRRAQAGLREVRKRPRWPLPAPSGSACGSACAHLLWAAPSCPVVHVCGDKWPPVPTGHLCPLEPQVGPSVWSSLDALTQHQGGGTCPGRQGCGSTPFPSCSVLGACCGHTGQGSRSGADRGHLRALPIPAPGWRPLASPTARSDPAARAGLPAPAPAWARMTHSVCSVGRRRVGSESRPNMELFVLSEAQGHAGGTGGAGLSQGERVPGHLGACEPTPHQTR